MTSNLKLVLFLILPILIAIFCAKSPYPLNQIPSIALYINPRLIQLLGIGILCIAFQIFHWNKPISKLNVVDISFAFFATWGFLSTTWAVNFPNAFYGAALTFLMFALYFVFKEMFISQQKQAEKFLLNALQFVCAVFLIHYAFDIVSTLIAMSHSHPDSNITIAYFYKARSFVGGKNSSLYTIFLFLALLFPLLISSGKSKIIPKILIFSLLVFIIIVFTRSVLIGTFVFFICIFFFFRKNVSYKSPLIKPFFTFLIIAPILIGVSYLFFEDPLYLNALNLGESIESNSVSSRFELWLRSFKLFVNDPILGIGNNCWQILYKQFGIEGIGLYPIPSFDQPHNDFIMVLTELGIIGFIFYFLIFVFQIKAVSNIPKDDSQNLDKAKIILSAIIAYSVIICFDGIRFKISQQIFLMILFALLAFYTNNKTEKYYKKATSVILRSILALVLVGTLVGLQQRYGSYIAYSKSKEYFKNKNYKLALQTYNNNSFAFLSTYKNIPVETLKGNILKQMGKSNEAKNAYQEANKSIPFNPTSNRQLGLLHLQEKNYKLAEKYLLESYNLNPCIESTIFSLHLLHVEMKDYEKAKFYLDKIFSNKGLKRRERLLKKLRRLAEM